MDLIFKHKCFHYTYLKKISTFKVLIVIQKLFTKMCEFVHKHSANLARNFYLRPQRIHKFINNFSTSKIDC